MCYYIQITDHRKCYIAFWIGPFVMTLNDLEGHSATARITNGNRQAFVQHFALSLGDSWASSMMSVCMITWTNVILFRGKVEVVIDEADMSCQRLDVFIYPWPTIIWQNYLRRTQWHFHYIVARYSWVVGVLDYSLRQTVHTHCAPVYKNCTKFNIAMQPRTE